MKQHPLEVWMAPAQLAFREALNRAGCFARHLGQEVRQALLMMSFCDWGYRSNPELCGLYVVGFALTLIHRPESLL